MTEQRETTKTGRKECEACKGKGRVEYYVAGEPEEDTRREDACAACEGEGFLYFGMKLSLLKPVEPVEPVDEEDQSRIHPATLYSMLAYPIAIGATLILPGRVNEFALFLLLGIVSSLVVFAFHKRSE